MTFEQQLWLTIFKRNYELNSNDENTNDPAAIAFEEIIELKKDFPELRKWCDKQMMALANKAEVDEFGILL